MSTNYQFFLQTNLDAYIGQWVAIADKEIISHGKDFKKVFVEAKTKVKRGKPFIARVPDKDTMIF